ncbi:MAG: outer membrane lipoprotein carrier protein LolA [Bacteroidales bacterium]|nr:outer membrane lipoprotein carrier protein LolA [Bacteroidales bacterium]
MSFTLVNGQNDPQAKAILDQVSAKNKAYKTVRTNFTLNISNTQNDEKSTQKGTLLLKGDKYVIKMPESEIYFDGKDVYNYLPQSKEVNITKPKPASKKGDDFSFSNPKRKF